MKDSKLRNNKIKNNRTKRNKARNNKMKEYISLYIIIGVIVLIIAFIMLSVFTTLGKMTGTHQKNGILIFFQEYLAIPIITITILIIMSIIFAIKKNFYMVALFIGILIFLYIITCIIPMPAKWFFEDYNDSLDNKDIMIKGTWTTVYKPHNGKVVKQISAPGVSHNNFSHVALPTPFRTCERNSCTFVTMMAHRISTRFMLLSLHRIKELDSKFFPKIYEIDDEKRRVIQEYVPYELNKETCPVDWKEQLKEFNIELKKNGYYVDDVHSKNWMVTEDGRLKVVDGELYTESELNIQQSLLNAIDGSQDGVAKGHKNASNILHWKDGRPNIENICNDEIESTGIN